jgi:hypothetical protein
MPAGMLTTMPTTVEAAAIKPTVDSGTSRDRINRGSAGFLDIVELKMASPPMIQSIKNGEILFGISPPVFHIISQPAQGFTSYRISLDWCIMPLLME